MTTNDDGMQRMWRVFPCCQLVIQTKEMIFRKLQCDVQYGVFERPSVQFMGLFMRSWKLYEKVCTRNPEGQEIILTLSTSSGTNIFNKSDMNVN